MDKTIRIGTRKSALAMAQTRLVAGELQRAWPGVDVEFVTKETLGDKVLDRPLQEFGGKGVFVSELEKALSDGRIDLAVHSAKDMPMDLADGLSIAAVSEREDPRDVFVYKKDSRLWDNEMVRVGTSSPRRRLLAGLYREQIWPGVRECVCELLRGNVQTRLEKLAQGHFDGIILAAAGLKRLGLLEDSGYKFLFLDPQVFIPAGGQGIMAVEARQNSREARLCQAIDHREARLCLTLERRILKLLNAGCQEPIGVYSSLEGERLKVWGVSSRRGGVKNISLEGGVSLDEVEALAQQTAKGLM